MVVDPRRVVGGDRVVAQEQANNSRARAPSKPTSKQKDKPTLQQLSNGAARPPRSAGKQLQAAAASGSGLTQVPAAAMNDEGTDFTNSEGADYTYMPLVLHEFMLAARSGDHEACEKIAERLTRAGLSIDSTDVMGRTALHHAASNGHVCALETLLDLQLDDEACDAQGQTPLHLCCAGGHVEALELLVDMGADIDARAGPSLKRWNSIMFAAANGHVDCIAILTHANADLLDTLDTFGHSALQIAWNCNRTAAAEALEVAVEARRLRNKKQKATERNIKDAYLRRLSTKRLLRQSSRFSLSAMDAPESLASSRPLQRLHRGFRRVSLAAGVLARIARAPRSDNGAPQVVQLRRSRSDDLARASSATAAVTGVPSDSRPALWSTGADGGGESLTA